MGFQMSERDLAWNQDFSGKLVKVRNMQLFSMFTVQPGLRCEKQGIKDNARPVSTPLISLIDGFASRQLMDWKPYIDCIC